MNKFLHWLIVVVVFGLLLASPRGVAAEAPGRVFVLVGTNANQLGWFSMLPKATIGDALAVIGGLRRENQRVALVRGGVWYIFGERAFNDVLDKVTVANGDQVFVYNDDPKIDDLRSAGFTVYIGADAVTHLRR